MRPRVPSLDAIIACNGTPYYIHIHCIPDIQVAYRCSSMEGIKSPHPRCLDVTETKCQPLTRSTSQCQRSRRRGEVDPLRKRCLVREVDRARTPAHVLLPRVAARLTSPTNAVRRSARRHANAWAKTEMKEMGRTIRCSVRFASCATHDKTWEGRHGQHVVLFRSP